MSAIRLIIVALTIAVVSSVFQGIRFQTLRKGIAFAGAAVIPFMDFQPPNANAIPALEAATRAMTDKKEKDDSKGRDFATMPDGAKKRYALTLCKDNNARSLAGYSSAATCTEAVFAGNYKNIVEGTPIPGASTPMARKAVIRESSGGGGGGSTGGSSKVMTKKAEVVTKKADGPLVKVQDLSDLSAASKKRRALAACKKGSTRSFAKAGSEDKCTKAVLEGNYQNIIEALEYGR